MPLWPSCLPLPAPRPPPPLYLHHREKELDEYERLLFSDDYDDFDDEDDTNAEDTTTYEKIPDAPNTEE